MALIAEQDRQTIQRIFAERLPNEVRITNFGQRQSLLITPGLECQYCEQTRTLLEEVAGLADHVTLETKDFVADAPLAESYGVKRIPAFVLEGRAQGRVRYFGVPGGYEFSALIEDLLDVSTGETDLSAQTKALLARIDRPVHIQVFATPTCPYCPRAARLAHKLAIECPYITADVIDAIEFPDLANRYDVYGVPKVVINETVQFEGALPEPQYVAYVVEAYEWLNSGPENLPDIEN